MEPVRMLRADFRSSLTALEDDVLLVGRQVEQLVLTAMQALETTSPALTREVLTADDAVDLEVHRLEEQVLSLLTLQGPVADDLRLLLSLQKVCSSIERIGDGCVNIARLGADLHGIDGGSEELMAQMHELGRRAQRAVRTGLDDFGRRRTSTERLEKVEDQIDLLHDGLTARLIDHATLGRAQTTWAVRMVLASRHLERIGDHAVKIAGEGAFVTTGRRPLPRSHG